MTQPGELGARGAQARALEHAIGEVGGASRVGEAVDYIKALQEES